MVKRLEDFRVKKQRRAGDTITKSLPLPAPGEQKTTSLNVSLTLLRTCHAALAAGAHSARTASIKNQLTAAASALAGRMGGALAPDWDSRKTAAVRRKATGFAVTLADGTEHTVGSGAAAARLVGLTPASLRVALARGGGTYSAKRGDSAVTVRRVFGTKGA